jgi:hypothetical protein
LIDPHLIVSRSPLCNALDRPPLSPGRLFWRDCALSI